MILVVDAGNTHIHLGLYTRTILRATWKLATDQRRTADEYAFLMHGLIGESTELEGAIICSVVPGITRIIAEALENACHLTAMVLDSKTDIGLINGYRHPDEVG